MSNPRRQGQARASGALLVCLDLQSAHLRDGADCGACARLLAFARQSGWSVVHVHRIHDFDDGASIAGFEPLPNEPVFFRDGTSALSNPRVAEIVHGAEGIDVLIAGFDLRTSGVATAFDAYNQGARVTLVRDALYAAMNGDCGAEAAVLDETLWRLIAPFADVTSTDNVFARRSPVLPVANENGVLSMPALKSVLETHASRLPTQDDTDWSEFADAVARLSPTHRALITRICRQLERLQAAHGAEVAEAAVERVIRALERENVQSLS